MVENFIIPVVGALILIIYGIGFISPLFVFYATLKFNKLTKFGILMYFSLIFVGLWNYLPLFNENIVESAGIWFEIICGISYLIFIVFLVLPDAKQPKIYIDEEKAEN